MTDNVAPAPHERPLPKLRVEIIDKKHETFRDWLMAILEWEDLGEVTITLRGGKEITIGPDKSNPLGRPVRVRVGRDYIEVGLSGSRIRAHLPDCAVL